MFKFLKSNEEYLFAIMRIAIGFTLFWHGSQKLLNIPPSGFEVPPFILYIAGPIELIGGLFILFGLFTKYAAFLSSGLMAFAYWMGHGTQALLPIQNQGELAFLYCFVFLFVAAKGSSVWSLDNVIFKSEKEKITA
ncbi:MAG: DoxX family protein [Ignavibacterium sp.]